MAKAPTNTMIEAWLTLPSHYSFSEEQRSATLPTRPTSVPVMSPTRARTSVQRPTGSTNSPNIRSTIMYVTDGAEASSKPREQTKPENEAPAPPPIQTYVTSITTCTRKTTKKTNTITISSRRALQQATVEKPLQKPVQQPKPTPAPVARVQAIVPRLPILPAAPAAVPRLPITLRDPVPSRPTAVITTTAPPMQASKMPTVSIPSAQQTLTRDLPQHTLPREIPQWRRNDELHIPEELLEPSSLPSTDFSPGGILATRTELKVDRKVRKAVSSDGLIPVASGPSTTPAEVVNNPQPAKREHPVTKPAVDNIGLEFQIYAEDVIPTQPVRPTTPVRPKVKTDFPSPVSDLSHMTPRREARWDLDGPISPISEPDLNELHFKDELPSRNSWGSTGRSVVKRKPAPSVRVHSLPMLIINKEHTMDCHGTLSSSSDGSPYLSPAGAGPRDDYDKLFADDQISSPLKRFLNNLQDTSNLTSSEQNSPTIKSPTSPNNSVPNNLIPPTTATTDWRSLSFLDLTSNDELLIYLKSLVLIHEFESQSQKEENASADSPRFNSIASSPTTTSRYSFYSDLPSPSSYNPLTSLPMPIPREPPRMGDIHLGQLRLTPKSTIYIPLDISLKVFKENTMYNHSWQMPCRTTILTGTRRVTFVKPPGPQAGNDSTKMQSLIAPVLRRSTTIGSGKGLINRDNSKRIRSRGGTILRHRGRDIYLELIDLGSLTGAMAAPPLFDVFLNRVDGSVWLVFNPRQSGSASGGVLDCWAFSTLGIKRKGNEKVVAVRWADGLDCVHEFRGGNLGPVVARMARVGGKRGEMEIECGVIEMEGVEVYLGEGVKEEEDGWFVPEGY